MHRPTVIVGAGVVGLAAARALAQTGREVVVLEAASRIGTGVTSRSSEVMHAGLYYPPGSRKADTCLRGHDLLRAYARERSIPHRGIGKLIVATDEDQIAPLAALRDNAHRCGAGELAWLSAAELREREPEVHGVAALWSPRSGIVDSHQAEICESLVPSQGRIALA